MSVIEPDPIFLATRGSGFDELPELRSRSVVGMRTDATSYRDAVHRIVRWSNLRDSRYVCVANVHMTMESYDAPNYRDIVNGSDLVTPDGMPLVWALRLLGIDKATRVYGPILMMCLLQQAADSAIPVGFYGSRPDVLEDLLAVCARRFRGLHVAYSHAPPFRPATPEEDAATIRAINGSGTRILFVGLGCPKQERWMSDHRGEVNAVMVGVGAAFDFIAGTKAVAPAWMQQSGLEWLFRLATEPRRLWRRYAYHNPRFAVLLATQYVKQMLG